MVKLKQTINMVHKPHTETNPTPTPTGHNKHQVLMVLVIQVCLQTLLLNKLPINGKLEIKQLNLPNLIKLVGLTLVKLSKLVTEQTPPQLLLQIELDVALLGTPEINP